MGDIMQKNINKVKEGGVRLIDHTISLLCVIATMVVTYEIRVFFEGAQKEVFSSIFKKTL
jgi:hypothetical protein